MSRSREIAEAIFDRSGNLLFENLGGRRRALAERASNRAGGSPKWLLLPEERAILGALAAVVVPTDESGPGAADLERLTGQSIADLMEPVISASPEKQVQYERGLIAFDSLARTRHGKAFVALAHAEQVEIFGRAFDRHAYRHRAVPLARKMTRRFELLAEMASGAGPAIDLVPVITHDVFGVFYSNEVSWGPIGYDGPPMPGGYPDLERGRALRRDGTQQPRDERASARESVGQSAASHDKPGSAPFVHTTAKDDDTRVVVIGSGAGGAVVTKELAEAGLDVVVLEAGRRFDPSKDYVTDRDDFESVGNRFHSNWRRDLYTTTGAGFSFNRVKGIGGSTLKYQAMSPRFHESDFRVRTEDGIADDWPIKYSDLEPYYSRVEYELGVSGPDGADANPFDPPRGRPFPLPPHRLNMAGQAVRRGAERLGLHLVREPLAIPSANWNGRPACVGAGTCSLGCSISAKSSMDVTYFRKAEATGRVDARPESMAFRIELGKDGKARRVLYYDRDGRERAVGARAVVVAGNAVETPRLLLMSTSGAFPDGLANSSGMVGRNFMEHLAVFVHGIMPEPTNPWRGTPTNGMLQDDYATAASRAFARGWTTLVAGYSPWPVATAHRINGWGNSHRAKLQHEFSRSVCLASIGEQLPDPGNRVSLDPAETDLFGLPVPRLANTLGTNDRAMVSAIRARLVEILTASGATSISFNEYAQGASSHYLGTCRMGNDPRSSVVDAWGRAHDVPNLFIADGSVMVTGAAVNPALTISALATRTAEAIARAASQHEL